jgi:hypothetical protein
LGEAYPANVAVLGRSPRKFREPSARELRRIHLLRTRVNKGIKKGPELDIHDWTMTISAEKHHEIHRWWNTEWLLWILEHEHPTLADVENKAAELLERAGIEHEWMHSYRMRREKYMPDVEELIDFARERNHAWLAHWIGGPGAEVNIKDLLLNVLYAGTAEQSSIRDLDREIEHLNSEIEKVEGWLRSERGAKAAERRVRKWRAQQTNS